ncbi:hypothetical protein H5V45_04190 [Nocardioides sp. KIGAM211]|uniref:SbsA Ig-like domain-containing protein n=1 Tax=Nocardioides luti TaxID=2761101 RepID=A0A7X0VAV8_9ACTN|nr:hypothetical protein [Nocardioides luti]MBB6626518.1 hypothetical protein [Nocardioides luti]
MLLRPLALTVAALATTLATFAAPPAPAHARADIEPPLNDCWATYYARAAEPRPDVTSVSFSPRTVDVSAGPATVEVVVEVGPPEAKVVSASASFTTEVTSRGRTKPGFGFASLSPDPADSHRLTGTLTVPQGASDYHLDVVSAVDDQGRPGQEMTFTDDDPAALVTVTSPPDTAKPVIDSFTVSPASVDTTRHSQVVTFTAHVHDEGSGVAEVTTEALGREPVSLAPTDDPAVWAGTTTIPRFLGRQTWRWGLVATDRAKNLGGTPASDDLQHRTVSISSGPRDRTAPRLSGLSTSPRPLDVREKDGELVIRAHVTDADSGVRQVSASVGGTGSPRYAPLELVSGTLHDGVWRARVAITTCVGGTDTLRVLVTAEDGLYNRRVADVPFRVLAHDRLAPEFRSVTRPRTPRQDIVVTFTEPVMNVAGPDVALIRATSRAQRVDGAWRCFNGHRRVGCVTGRVLRAVFDPSDRLRPGYYYLVTDSKGRHPVRDRAGNPITASRGIQVDP